ncbi:hypothetical protein VPH35_127231 [Triticum aestivum]|uniref:uncharacterized protein n=1 Tax=Triticum aestivum TaxID=4565 RepID=UPI000843ACF9|nr:uncharacterized protein LOC123161337 [Triticum aestivum]
MDRFHDRQHVRLRSRVHGTYLHANDDGQSVSLRRRRATMETAWTVHIYQGNGGMYLLLHSAAYGRYLAATATRAPLALGHLGFRAELRDYDQPEVEAIMWRAVEAGSSGDVMLRNAGGRYLRANGRHLPWNTRVSVDDADNTSTMMCWTLQTVPSRMDVPIPHYPVRPPGDWFGLRPGVWRTIRFVRTNGEGFYAEEEGWNAFPFRGRSVHHLRDELSARVNLHIFDLVACVRAGRYGRPTPLVANLPHGGAGETLEIVVVQFGTPVYGRLRYPDVHAE